MATGALDSKLKEMLIDQVTSYRDLRFYFYKSLTSIAKNHISDSNMKDNDSSSALLELLLIISISHEVEQSDNGRWVSFVSNQNSKKDIHHEISDSDMNKAFSDCWLAMLRVVMSLKGLKSVLLALDVHVIPKLNTPTLLSDFLTDAYNHGTYLNNLPQNVSE